MKKPILRTLAWLSSLGALALAILCARALAARGASWGLSFPAEGQPPVGNCSAGALAELAAAYLGDVTRKRIYLTFDAGYENGYTEKILDVLREHGVPAAFFLVGNYLETEPELVRRMVHEGHTVGNHTLHHYDMDRISDPEAFAGELTGLEALYTRVTGQAMKKYYRPPRGIYSEENLRQAKALGYRTVFWSLAYVDWQNDAQPTREQALEKLLPRIHNGAVVLLHSTSATNAAILDELLTRWQAEGYEFGTLDELFAEPPCGKERLDKASSG